MATSVLTQMKCGECGIDYAMPEFLYQARLVDHHSFYCPNGHNRHYPAGKTEVEKLREQLADVQAARDHADQQRRAAEANVERLRKAEKRTKKRAAAGVCPCCQRTVSQMARHIKTKHPEYAVK